MSKGPVGKGAECVQTADLYVGMWVCVTGVFPSSCSGGRTLVSTAARSRRAETSSLLFTAVSQPEMGHSKCAMSISYLGL